MGRSAFLHAGRVHRIIGLPFLAAAAALSLGLGLSLFVASPPASAQEHDAKSTEDRIGALERLVGEQQRLIEQQGAELRSLREGPGAAVGAGQEAKVPPPGAPSGPTSPTNVEHAAAAERLDGSKAERAPPDAEARGPGGLLPMTGERTDLTAPALFDEPPPSEWYDRIRLRGYVQLRYHALFDDEARGPALDVPADRSARDSQTFLIRRGRVILSGDVTHRLFLYAQLDFNASPGDGDFALQMRDLYADIAIDHEKAFRFRVGQSKVPFGWVNMQSSQNRAPLERPEAINSAAEGERDIGVFFYYAPPHVRERFRDLVRRGLKGSGDYGMIGVGAYAGQGPNRGDLNDELHWVARVTYPFALPAGQMLEAGVAAYAGRFFVRTESIEVGGVPLTPDAGRGNFQDRRVCATIVLYPQPFGVEAEWTIGKGPQLTDDLERVEVKRLSGGYIQANYKLDTEDAGTFLPFVRWSYYEGGRKFARNAPPLDVSEIDAGLEWEPVPEIEVTVLYSYTFRRTNTRIAPYEETERMHRAGFQVQWNF